VQSRKCILFLNPSQQNREHKVDIRALCIINPGNPTGQCLREEQMIEIVKFCKKHRLVLLADEVYQRNAYSNIPFVSFRKVLKRFYVLTQHGLRV
jgi:alanine transaminase